MQCSWKDISPSDIADDFAKCVMICSKSSDILSDHLKNFSLILKLKCLMIFSTCLMICSNHQTNCLKIWKFFCGHCIWQHYNVDWQEILYIYFWRMKYIIVAFSVYVCIMSGDPAAVCGADKSLRAGNYKSVVSILQSWCQPGNPSSCQPPD